MPLHLFFLRLYWILASVVIFAKNIIPFLLNLNYGKLQHSQHTSNSSPFLFQFLIKPLVTPRIAWPSFYLCAISTTLLSISYAHYFPLPLTLFLCQVARRYIESTFVHTYSDQRLSPLLLLSGFSFYVAAPVTIFSDLPSAHTKNSLLSFIAIFLFAAASFVQNATHRELANLKPIVGKYGIPNGYFFRLIFCPHYLSEIIIYFIIAILTNGPGVFLMLLFVIINLSDSALRTARWYRQTFPKSMLPQRRHAILPYLI